MAPCAVATDIVNKANQGKTEKYVVPVLHQKRKEHAAVVHGTNQAVHQASKFYQGNEKMPYIFNEEIPIQIAPTDEVEPKFRTPCRYVMVNAIKIQLNLI